MMGQMIERTLETISSSIKNYIGGNWQFYVFCACAIFLLVFANKKRACKFLGFYNLLALLLFCFPVTAYLISAYGIGFDVYWRVLWIVPIPLVMAYACTLAVDLFKKNVAKSVVAIAAAVLIILSGTNMYRSGLFDPAPNAYKLPVSVFSVSDAILEDAANNASSDLAPRVVMPDSLISHVRQYKPEIHTPYGRNGVKDWDFESPEAVILADSMNNMRTDTDTLLAACQLNDCPYLVLSTDDPRNSDLMDQGVTILAQDERYVTYRLDY